MLNRFKLDLNLGQISKIYLTENYEFKKKNTNLRKELSFCKNNISKIEKFMRQILPEVLPTDIVENFNFLDQKF